MTTSTEATKKSLIWSSQEIETFVKILDKGPLMSYQAVRKKWIPSLTKDLGCFNRKSYRNGLHFEEWTVNQNSPFESQAIYLSDNTRDLVKAGKQTAIDAVKFLTEGNDQKISQLDKQFQTNCQKCQNLTYIVVDLDLKSKFSMIKQELITQGIIVKVIIETRGGYHFLIKTDLLTSEMKKYIYTNLKKNKFVDILKNPFSPVPGTYQGGFKVKLIFAEGNKT